MKTMVAVYDELDDAYQVIEALRDVGVDRSNISLATGDPGEEYAPYFQKEDSEMDEPVAGALAGGAIGGITGLLLGLGTLAVPGIGPVVAAGPLVSGLIGAGVGAAGGGLLGALVEAGVPEEEAGHYLESIRRGGTLVAVQVMNYQADDVAEIMERYNPINLEEQVRSWREEGWTGIDAGAATDTAATTVPALPQRGIDYGASNEPVFQDDLEDKYERAFRHHYQSHYALQGHPYQMYAPAYYHGYQLAVDARYNERDWDDVEPVARRLWQESDQGAWEQFKEAVRYGWREGRDTLESDEDDIGNDYDEVRFRRHYDEAYAATDYDYESYVPAYRFGYLLADDMRYQDRPWDEIEPVVRERWERDHPGDRPWQEVKDAIRHAWEKAQV